MRGQEWRDHALCVNAPDPDIFFPDPKDIATQALAKSWCYACPVRPECLDFHLRAESPSSASGIVGGMTEGERRGYLRRIRRYRRDTRRPETIPNAAS